jgi:hypothetical protein
MSSSVADKLDRVVGKPLKCGPRRTSETFVRAGSLVETAIQRAYPKQEAAAQDYGTSPSLLSRQMRNQDDQHLSFQRLWSMPVHFKLVLVDLLMTDLKAGGAPIEGETTWRIRRTA